MMNSKQALSFGLRVKPFTHGHLKKDLRLIAASVNLRTLVLYIHVWCKTANNSLAS